MSDSCGACHKATLEGHFSGGLICTSCGELTAERCRHCNSDKLVTNYHAGERVCTSCGVVAEERMISFESEFRRFEDDIDGEKKVRTGESHSIFGYNSVCTNVGMDEKEYYQNGCVMLKGFFTAHFPDTRPRQIEQRAREIFDNAFRLQKEQKAGNKEFNKKEGNSTLRKKYSRKRQFIVASIWVAFMEGGYSASKWSISNISRHFSCRFSEQRIGKCLELLNCDIKKVRNVNAKLKSRRRHRHPVLSYNDRCRRDVRATPL